MDDLQVTIFVIDVALWATALVLSMSKHVKKYEGQRHRRR